MKTTGKIERIKRKLNSAIPYIFISPFFLLFFIFSFYPMLATLYYSFTDWGGIGSYEFVGLKNYIRLFNDPMWLVALRNTAFFTAIIVPSIIILALVLALILNSPLVKFKNFFRLTSILPTLMSLAVVVLVFRMIFSREFGLINLVLSELGLPTFNVDWFNDPKLGPWMVISMVLWRWVGYNSVIALAGLQGIPMELYDAAKVDGAGLFQRLWHITLPSLFPIFTFMFMTNTIALLQMFTEVYVLSPTGGPMGSLMTGMLYVFRQSFNYFKFGYAAAASYILTLVSLVIAIIQIKYLVKVE